MTPPAYLQHSSDPLDRTRELRRSAQELIDSLLRARDEIIAKLQADQRDDAMTSVRGTSSLDEAIADAERTRDALDRVLDVAVARSDV